MITYKQIKKAINDKLTARFEIEINSRDIKEGFSRPSFFVDFENISKTGLESQIERSFTVRIYFFPKDKNSPSMEILEILEGLEEIFDLKLRVEDRHFNIFETKGETTDGVLQFEFDINYEDGREIAEAETMQELEYKNEVQ